MLGSPIFFCEKIYKGSKCKGMYHTSTQFKEEGRNPHLRDLPLLQCKDV